MILFRHVDPRFPFLWESRDQPPGRWHGEGDGPVHYLADTPDGAWAEFIRHEGITLEAELENVRRALWAVEVPENLKTRQPVLPVKTLTGGASTYPACRKESRRLRAAGAGSLRAIAAALLPGGGRGWNVNGGLHTAKERDGFVFVLFGIQSELVGWPAAIAGRPDRNLLARVRTLAGTGIA